MCAYIRLLHVGLFSVCVLPLHQMKTFLSSDMLPTSFPSVTFTFFYFPLWQFEDVGSHGTKVIIYNMWLNSDAKLELDFDSVAEVYSLYLYVSDFLFIAK